MLLMTLARLKRKKPYRILSPATRNRMGSSKNTTSGSTDVSEGQTTGTEDCKASNQIADNVTSLDEERVHHSINQLVIHSFHERPKKKSTMGSDGALHAYVESPPFVAAWYNSIAPKLPGERDGQVNAIIENVARLFYDNNGETNEG